MARKFKCRNGTILEECKKGEHLLEYFTNKGYSSNYNVIYDPSCKYKKGKFMGLRAKGQVYFPVGGVYGTDYDVVEELLPKKQQKIPVATNAVLYESAIHDDLPKWYMAAKEWQKKSKGIVLKYEQYPNAPEGDFHTTDRFYLNRDIAKLSKEEKADLVVKLSQFLELPICTNTASRQWGITERTITIHI